MLAVPFTLRAERKQLAAGAESHFVRTQMVGVVALDGDLLSIQFRIIERFWRYSRGNADEGTTESQVGEVLIGVRALRSVRVGGRWWSPRLEIATSDLRALEGFPHSGTGDVSLRIRRRDRTDARELASMIEYARALWLLADPDRV